MTYKPFVKVPNLTQAGCTRQNRPGRDALIDLGHGSLDSVLVKLKPEPHTR